MSTSHPEDVAAALWIGGIALGLSLLAIAFCLGIAFSGQPEPQRGFDYLKECRDIGYDGFVTYSHCENFERMEGQVEGKEL